MIDPNNTNTIRVGELPLAPFNLTDNIPHEIGIDLKRGTVQQLADLISSVIEVTGGVGFRAISVTDGQTLPTTTQQEFILVGKGTYFNVSGGETIVLTEELNALVSNGTFWFVGVEIPVNVELAGITQFIREGFLTTIPSEDAVFKFIQDLDLSTKINGSGTTNFIPKFTDSGTLGDSKVLDNSNGIDIKNAISNTNIFTKGVITSLADWDNTEGGFALVSGGGVNAVQPELGTRKRLKTAITLEKNKIYKLEFEVSNHVSGSVVIDLGGAFSKPASSNGIFSEFMYTFDSNDLAIQAGSNMNLTINNIKVFEVVDTENLINGNLAINGTVNLNGVLGTPKNKRILIGNWDNGLNFSEQDEWHKFENGQPSISIGDNAMPFGTGVAIGANAGTLAGINSYITAVGNGALKRNISGHATAFGTQAGQNITTANAAIFGDEAASQATTEHINAFGYYALNLSTTGKAAGFGHEIFRNATTGDNTGLGYRLGYNTTTGTVVGVGMGAAYYNTTGSIIAIGNNSAGGVNTSVGDGRSVNDTNSIFIGNNSKKINDTDLDNVIVIGHGARGRKSNQVVLGNNSNTETLLTGKLLLNTFDDSFSSNFSFNTNARDGLTIANESSGTSAEASVWLKNAQGGVFQINHASDTHSVWSGFTRFQAPKNLAFLTGSGFAQTFFINGVETLRLSADSDGAAKVTGKMTVSAAPTNPTDVVRKTELDLKANDNSVIKTTGDQTGITGTKSFSNSTNTSTLNLNLSNNAQGFVANNAGTSIAVVANNTGTGLSYVGQNNGTNTFTVDKTGLVTLVGGTTLNNAVPRSQLLYTNQTITANKTVTTADFVNNNELILSVDATGGNITITLPTFTALQGYKVTVKKMDSSANSVLITGVGGVNIDDSVSVIISGKNSSSTVGANLSQYIIL